MSILRVASLIWLALALTACTTLSSQQLPEERAATFQGKTIVTSMHEPVNFMPYTAGKAMLGALGAGMIISDGKRTVEKNAIEDPSRVAGSELMRRIATAHGMNVVDNEGVVTSRGTLKDVLATYQGADYILDLRTNSWGYIYYPTKWGQYRVQYAANMRLIDAASQEVIAQSSCRHLQEDADNPPSRDALLANEAELLKEFLARASTKCVDDFSSKIFRL